MLLSRGEEAVSAAEFAIIWVGLVVEKEEENEDQKESIAGAGWLGRHRQLTKQSAL